MSVLIVHGGVNVEESREVKEVLEFAAAKGFEKIEKSILDAVETAIVIMEDDYHFNAGYGSVLNRDGEVEMDAAIMFGKSGRAGGVAALKRVKNPISVARKILEDTRCVLIAGDGAHRFAVEKGFEVYEDVYPGQVEFWRKARSTPESINGSFDIFTGNPIARGGDTVGCIAINNRGELACGTSTGGSFYKLPGRIGDSPIPGAGFYASERCAVSCSGSGEAFLQLSVAKMVDIWSWDDDDPGVLAERAVDLLDKKGERGGLIVLNHRGRWGMSHNCKSFPLTGINEDGYFTG